VRPRGRVDDDLDLALALAARAARRRPAAEKVREKCTQVGTDDRVDAATSRALGAEEERLVEREDDDERVELGGGSRRDRISGGLGDGEVVVRGRRRQDGGLGAVPRRVAERGEGVRDGRGVEPPRRVVAAGSGRVAHG